MKRERYLALVFFVALFFVCGCKKDNTTQAGPRPAAVAVGHDLTMHPNPGDRCPVCAMSTHDKKLPAAISLKDGRTYYFCGPGCMIRTWLDPRTHLGVEKSALEHAVATSYLKGTPIDGEHAIWVVGSDVVGPMGPMPVPLENDAEVEAFKERHGGTTTFYLKEMTLEKWAALKKRTSK